MKKILFVLIACSLMLTSCGPSAVKFNDTLIDYVDKAHTQINSLEDLLDSASDRDDILKVVSSIPPVVDSLNVYIKAVDAQKAPKDGEEFKTGVLNYLNSLVAMADSYNAISNITDDSTEEETDSIIETITSKGNDAEKLFDDIQKLQVTFAAKNHMKLK